MPLVYLNFDNLWNKTWSSKHISLIFHNIHLKKAFFPFHRAQEQRQKSIKTSTKNSKCLLGLTMNHYSQWQLFLLYYLFKQPTFRKVVLYSREFVRNLISLFKTEIHPLWREQEQLLLYCSIQHGIK